MGTSHSGLLHRGYKLYLPSILVTLVLLLLLPSGAKLLLLSSIYLSYYYVDFDSASTKETSSTCNLVVIQMGLLK